MRAVIQRVTRAGVAVDGAVCAQIQLGLLVLVGIEAADTDEDAEWLAGKLVRLRVFDDESGVMNRSVQDVGGDILLVSQFTLFASTRKGNRPSHTRAAPPEFAQDFFDRFRLQVEAALGKPVPTGRFGAHMDVDLTNSGPVTILIDTRHRE